MCVFLCVCVCVCVCLVVVVVVVVVVGFLGRRSSGVIGVHI